MWAIRALKVFLLTVILGVSYYIVKYFIDTPPKPNMY